MQFKIRHQSAEKVSKEIAMNLLEQSLYFHWSRITVSCIKLNQKRKKLDHSELKSKKHQAVRNKG